MTARSLISVLLAGALCAGCGGGAKSEEEVTANAPVPVATQPAARGTVEGVTTTSGMVVAAPGAELIVIAPLPGRIARLPKGEGDAVRKGDLLVEFDIPSSQADVAKSEAELAQARAKLTNAKNALTRLQGLLERGVAARKEVEDAQRDASDAEAAVKNGEVARAASERVASRTTVAAPFAGVVAKRWHNPGDLVDAAATDPVLRIVDPARAEVTAAVPASVASRIHAGQPARIRNALGSGAGSAAPDDAGGEAGDAPSWPASVLTKPTVVDPATATANVRIALHKKSDAPPIGTAVRVDIVTDTRKDAVTVPPDAIVRDEGKTFVFVAGADKKAHRREVKVGVSSEAGVEILSGVTAGDNVIIRGQSELPDGAAIRAEEIGGEGKDSDEKDSKEKDSKGAGDSKDAKDSKGEKPATPAKDGKSPQ